MRRIMINFEKCLGCHSCELACAVVHSESQNLLGALLEKKTPLSRVAVGRSGTTNYSLQCRHCSDARCIKACLAGALYRDPGTQTVQQYVHKCVGCWMCIMACPFGLIAESTDGRTAGKCDLCLERDIPACVNACLTGALVFEEITDYNRQKRLDYLIEFQRKEEVAANE